MQTDHNLLQSGELKWNLLKIGTKDLNFQILMLIRKHCNPLCNLIHAYVNEKKIVSNWHYNSHGIGKGFSFKQFIPCFCHYFVPSSNINAAPFSAYETHTTHCSSNCLGLGLDKNLPVSCLLFYSSHLLNRNHMHSLSVNHLYLILTCPNHI